MQIKNKWSECMNEWTNKQKQTFLHYMLHVHLSFRLTLDGL